MNCTFSNYIITHRRFKLVDMLSLQFRTMPTILKLNHTYKNLLPNYPNIV